MADGDSVRQRIISSVFTTKLVDERYVAHVKIWEEDTGDGGGKKPRYIIISRSTTGVGFIHKSKLNSNGSFSVGKTWKLSELRGIEVLNPSAFNISMSRTYRWQTENQRDQSNFISELIQLFRSVSGPSAQLDLAGVRDSVEPSSRPAPPAFQRMDRAPTPTNGAPLPTATPRRTAANGYADTSSSYQNGRYENGRTVGTPGRARSSSRARRPRSPAESSDFTKAPPTAVPERAATPSRTRPTTPSREPLPPPSALRPRHGRAPSNADTSSRTSAATTSSIVPSIAYPSSVTSVQSEPQSQYVDSRMNGYGSRPSLDAPSTSPASVAQPPPRSTYGASSEFVTSRSQAATPNPTARPRPSETNGSTPLPRAPRRENTRVSFYDTTNQALLNRVLSGDTMLHEEGDAEGEGAGEVEEESAQATLESVEEMLEGYEWASDDILGRRALTGTAEQIEARLLDELMALDKANIHSFIESDDRIGTVLKYLDEAILELDNMESVMSSYKIYLNAVSDDIAYIQSQGRGLQVQTQNQRALLDELEELLQTVQVDSSSLLALTQESLEQTGSIQKLEKSTAVLYKALLAGRDRDMSATMERLDEYKKYNAQFCKRVLDYLSIVFTAQGKMLLGDDNGISKSSRGRVTIKDHRNLESYLERYRGLLLYLKEMDESAYAKICAAYFSAASELHASQTKAMLTVYASMIKKAPTEEEAEGFSGVTSTSNTSKAAQNMRRAGTIVRSPLERREKKDGGDGELRAAEALGLALEQLARTIYAEEGWVSYFLQMDDVSQTFADHMGLENYFRRQAARFAGLSPATMKLVRGAMDLIFGFLPIELKSWLDVALTRDSWQVVGMLAALEKFQSEAEEKGNAFLLTVLEKQHMRLKAVFERRVNDQIKSIEETKLTSKKRKGVAPFIKFFPTYISRIETQLIGGDTLEIRQFVDAAYDNIVQAMFDALKQMAKMSGDEEDKGMLNYHVIIIENMHFFVAEVSQIEIGTVAAFLKRAEAIYEENLQAYVKIVLRRPFSKIIEYFEGVERLLKTTAPTEDYNAKDIRKYVDTLFKRVEKHFDEASEKATTEDASANTGIAPGTVMVGVWKACEEELLRITDLFNKRIAQCYKETGVSLEYTAADVEGAFKRHRVSS
ncbi:exocyst complex component Sec3-domain-containing protein [Epithele typhae]|uniref:exocyst complex component Sec3-domain-containing protein n=1 Tax=Epithele typhae TaxID=378194 RepID=UPI0020081316|nr:exocyst complex component Sec3-domain-containing protein [Epithele typhae]KAH9944208.1 exocyst complex component Sec3-domain-containing protein [Epithele typhae]